MPAVAMRAGGPLLAEWQPIKPPKLTKSYIDRMPHTEFTIEEIMQRMVTILIKNMDLKWRKFPLRTLDLMKEMGLRGRQMKNRNFFNKAAYTLLGLRVVHRVCGNPIRWEISEEYREFGVPPISQDKRDTFKLAHLLKFARNRPPRYGPLHGLYRAGHPMTVQKFAERREARAEDLKKQIAEWRANRK